MKSLVIVIIFGVLIFLEVKTLIKNHRKGEILVVVVLYCIGFTLSFLVAKGVKVPNPNKSIENLVKMLPFL